MSRTTIVRQEVNESAMDSAIQFAVNHHGANRDAVIPILQEITDAFGFIPGEALGKTIHQ